MSVPPLFSLSNKLLLEIISNLPAKDICTCRLTCYKLNALIVNSQLIQYIIRTAQSGVFDPLEPGLSIPERLSALQRWEAAWAGMDLSEPSARIDAPVSSKNGRHVEFSFGRYFVVIREGYGLPAGYSFLDMRAATSLHADTALWTNIEIDTPNVLVFAFAPDLNLSVAISTPTTLNRQWTTLKICPMDFSTGKPHPLASQPSLEVTVAGASAYNLSDTEVIGDYILYWVGSPVFSHSANEGMLSNIYLVAWKEGWVSELRHSGLGVYGSVLSVLSEEIILLVRLRDPALELCRLANVGGPNQSLETVCILSLPGLFPGACLRWATCFGEHPGHALFSRRRHPPDGGALSTPSIRQQQQGPRYLRRRHLWSVPADGIISVVMHISSKSGNFRTVDLSVRCRTLLAFAAAQVGVGEPCVVPWEEWGPNGTRILEHESLTWGSLVGERRATVGQARHQARITMRDYNPFRVGLALERTGGPERETQFPSGATMKVVTTPSLCAAGDLFSYRVETRMPYVETVTPYPGCEGIFMDEDNLLAEVRTEKNERNFFLHCL